MDVIGIVQTVGQICAKDAGTAVNAPIFARDAIRVVQIAEISVLAASWVAIIVLLFVPAADKVAMNAAMSAGVATKAA